MLNPTQRIRVALAACSLLAALPGIAGATTPAEGVVQAAVLTCSEDAHGAVKVVSVSLATNASGAVQLGQDCDDALNVMLNPISVQGPYLYVIYSIASVNILPPIATAARAAESAHKSFEESIGRGRIVYTLTGYEYVPSGGTNRPQGRPAAR